MLTRSDIRTMATKACAAIVAEPVSPEILLTRDVVYMLGGFPPPPAVLREDVEAWGLTELKYIETLRAHVMRELGRWLVTVPSEGFRLLTPAESVDYGIRATKERVVAAIDRGEFIVGHARVTDSADVRRQVDAEMRLGALRGSVQAAMADETRGGAVRGATSRASGGLRADLEADS